MNYIGIRGHRGSGKKSFAALLSNTMDTILKFKSTAKIEFDNKYEGWVKSIMEDEYTIPEYLMDTDYTYIDAFGDVPKTFIMMLLGISQEDLDNDYKKDHMLVNMRTFELMDINKYSDIKILNEQEAYELMKHTYIEPIKEDWCMTVRNFIMYFGRSVMQQYFGQNVWIKTLKVNSSLFNNIFDRDDKYRIYHDVKTTSEVNYIKDLGGIIIKIKRKDHIKAGSGIDELYNDGRVDYEMEIPGDLNSIKEDIWNLANKIIENNGKNKE